MSTPRRATEQQWRQVEQVANIGSADCAAILELRDHLAALEGMYETQRLATLEWGKDLDKLKRWNDLHLQRIEVLEDAENYRQQDEDAERAADPAPASSLVERVAATLRQVQMDSPWIPRWKPEACSAIRVTAGELRAQGFVSAADWLEQEANR